ncbi:MAG: methyl-accepting chemotaxis protein [Treponema sp.]|jgi:methyl-accepting chemotaxis protein|nr:methyl-accepting chemotaxis protein [Treponema sp.]
MKLKFRLSIIIVVLLTVVVATISIILIAQAANMQLETVKASQQRLAEGIAMDIQRRYEVYLQTARNLAAIMGDYEYYDQENRRTYFLKSMESLLNENPHFVGIYAVLKPNVFDGLDAQYAGRLGSSATGQFIPQYTRETGTLELRSYAKYQSVNVNMTTGEELGEPEERTINGVNGYSFHFRLPIRNTRNEQVGTVGITANVIYTQEVVQAIVSDKTKYADIAAVAVYTNTGFIIGHFDAARIGKNVTAADVQLYGDFTSEVLSVIKAGQVRILTSYSTALKTNLQMALVPLVVGGISSTPWSVMVGCAEAVILSGVHRMIAFAIAIVVCSIIIAAILIFIIAGRIATPIVNVALNLKDISEGEGDLTQTIKINSKDEIGDLALYFNQTLEKIKNLIITIKNQVIALSGISSELASNMTETAAAVNQITTNIESIKERINHQSRSVVEANSMMRKITVNINNLNKYTDEQTSSVTQSSSSIEEMLANIQSVTQTLAKNAGHVKELADASEIGRTGLQDVATDIHNIAAESEGLMEINAVMQNIASQTNLLSMNAAIEAAHAGDAGKGFAVVADEIRKLAENSSVQSKTISTVLKKIKDSIDKIIKSTDEVLNKFEAIDSKVKIVANQETEIRNAMEEQGAGSKQILESIGKLNNITRLVKSSSQEMLEGSKNVINESRNLEMLTQEINNGMAEMSSGAGQINVSVNRVNTISGENKDSIDILVTEIAKFKVE